jgi:hypothetical protein
MRDVHSFKRMPIMKPCPLLVLCFQQLTAVSSLSVVRPLGRQRLACALQSSLDYEGGGSPPDDGLILNDIDVQMAKLRSKYPTSEADYLAMARARNAAKAPESVWGASTIGRLRPTRRATSTARFSFQ